MEAKTDTRRHLSAQARREVFRRFRGQRRFGGGIFCKREGLNTSSFHRWRQRLATPTAKARTAPEPGGATRQSAEAGFIEMGSMAAASAAAARLEVRLDLGAGLVLHVVRG